MFSSQATEAKVSLHNFKEQLTYAVLQVAEFAETFRPIEKFFMAGATQHPDYLEKLCRDLRSKNVSSVPAIKSQIVKHITYKRNTKTMLWEKITIEEKFTQEQLNHAHIKMIQLNEMYSKSEDFLNAYLLRQEEFYRNMSKKNVLHASSSKWPEIKKSDSTELLKKSLTTQLRDYAFLSPLGLAETITSIYNILLKSDLTKKSFYQQLALIIFIGRDISIHDESQRVLLPEMDDYISMLSILFVNLHQELKGNSLYAISTPGETKRPQTTGPVGAGSSPVLFKPTDKTVDITADELDLILTLREKGFAKNNSSEKSSLSQKTT